MAIAAALPAAFGVSPAFAQDTTLEEIVVTGIRASLENSMEAKKEATSIVEVVTAEEIGKLPDVSIAESIARLPGLTAQRLNGRGQVISVRGLAPDFTTALLNGREQVSAGDNRGVEFDQFPSELLSGVVVYKTPDAALLGQGLAGTVDLRTTRPLEYGKRALAANVRYEQTSLDALNAGTADDGIRYSASYIDQFRDGTVGVAIGFAHMTNPSQEQRFQAWGYADGPVANSRVLGGVKPFVRSGELERDGIIGVLEFAPNENFSTAIDVYYSEFTETQWLRGIEFPMQWGGAETLAPGYTLDNGLITQGVYNGVKAVVNQHVNLREAELFSAGWNTKFAMGDAWQGVVDISHSSIDREDLLFESNSGTAAGNNNGQEDNLGFRMTSRGAILTPTVDYTNASLIRLTSPRGWGGVPATGQVGYLNNPTIEDELNQIRLSANRDFDGVISGVDVGVNYSERKKTKTADEFFLGLAGGATEAPITNPIGITDLSFVGVPGMVSYNPLEVLRSGGYALIPNSNNDVVGAKPWEVEEKVAVAYVKADLATEIGSMPLTGNFGVQVVSTDQSSKGFAAGAVVVPVSDGDKYTKVLPSMNFTLEVADQQYVRLAAARTLARARMDDMRATKQYTFNSALANSTDINQSPWGGSSGNPRLRPWIADGVDLSYEMYFQDRKGYLALAAFHKDLKSYIYNSQVVVSFAGIPTPGFTPALTEGIISAPANAKGGTIKGLEAAFSVQGSLISDVLDGFGLIATASWTDSSIKVPNNPTQAIPGLSRRVTNFTLYYEKHGFSARVSNRARSNFLGEVSGFGAGRDYRLIAEESIVDAQIGYTFGGKLEGFSIQLQGNNLTDEPFKTFNQRDPREIIDYQVYGKTYLLGISYQMK